jgi:hypothetical protein
VHRDSEDDYEFTGKRDAARNNSGQPVDHSGPDLGVGPTLPATSGLTPEACPPSSRTIDNDGTGDADGSDSSGREALDSSQGTSGWGSGGEAPRALARAALRSEGPALEIDEAAISALISFFKLLDEWDREANRQ